MLISQSSESPMSCKTPQDEENMMQRSTEMKTKFQQKNSSAMSFRVSKFGYNKISQEKLKEGSETLIKINPQLDEPLLDEIKLIKGESVVINFLNPLL